MRETSKATNVADTPQLFSPVVELRQYTLNSGRREDLIRIFDTHLVEPQEAAGMAVIGQFRDLDWPDRFVWLRGFEDMETRRAALTAFYGGPVWAAYRDAANATMIDSDDVLLLKPAWSGAGFDLTGKVRDARPESASFAVLAATIFHIMPEAEADFATVFADEAKQRLARHGGPLLAAFVTEHAENTFPQLPVRADENVFVAFQGFRDAQALASHDDALAEDKVWMSGILPVLERYFSAPSQRLRLAPTARSRL
jgi:quinol monooxygenase YgiN